MEHTSKTVSAYAAPGIPIMLKVKPVLLTDEMLIDNALFFYNLHSGCYVTKGDLKNKRRDHNNFVFPRIIVASLLKEFKKYRLNDIALLLGKDHSTIVHYFNKLKELQQYNSGHFAVKSYKQTRTNLLNGIENQFFIC